MGKFIYLFIWIKAWETGKVFILYVLFYMNQSPTTVPLETQENTGKKKKKPLKIQSRSSSGLVHKLVSNRDVFLFVCFNPDYTVSILVCTWTWYFLKEFSRFYFKYIWTNEFNLRRNKWTLEMYHASLHVHVNELGLSSSCKFLMNLTTRSCLHEGKNLQLAQLFCCVPDLHLHLLSVQCIQLHPNYKVVNSTTVKLFYRVSQNSP